MPHIGCVVWLQYETKEQATCISHSLWSMNWTSCRRHSLYEVGFYNMILCKTGSTHDTGKPVECPEAANIHMLRGEIAGLINFKQPWQGA